MMQFNPMYSSECILIQNNFKIIVFKCHLFKGKVIRDIQESKGLYSPQLGVFT